MTIPPPPGTSTAPAASADTSTPPKPASWWRRNRLALLALVVLVPTIVAGVGWYGWHQFYGFDSRPFLPVTVEDKGTAELAGATWGPLRGQEIEDVDGLDVPEGTKVLAVVIPVASGSEGVSCRKPVLVQQETGRQWGSVRSELGLLSDPAEPEYCTTLDTGDYELIVPFVVPDDVDGPFWVDVWPAGVGGSFLRFPFEP